MQLSFAFGIFICTLLSSNLTDSKRGGRRGVPGSSLQKCNLRLEYWNKNEKPTLLCAHSGNIFYVAGSCSSFFDHQELAEGGVSKMKAKQGRITVDMEKEEGRPIGITCFGTKAGVIISKVSGMAEQMGIFQPGDRVVAANGRNVMRKEELFQILKTTKGKLTMTVERGRESGRLGQQKKENATEDKTPRAIVLKTEWREKEPLGIELNHDMSVKSVEKGTIFDGRIWEGDIVYSVSGKEVTTINEFYSAILTEFPKLNIGILDQKEAETSSEEETESTEGRFARMTLEVPTGKYTEESLDIRESHSEGSINIIVSGIVEAEGIQENELNPYDQLLAIDGTFLTDRDTAKEILTGAKTDHILEILIERPTCIEAFLETKAKLEAAEAEDEREREKRQPKRSLKIKFCRKKREFCISSIGTYLQRTGLNVGDQVTNLNGVTLSLQKPNKDVEREEETVESAPSDNFVMVEREMTPLTLPEEREETEKEETEEKEQLLSMTFEYEPNKPLDITMDPTLMVTRIQPGSLTEGQLQLGDIITTVNGEAVRDKDGFFQLLELVSGTVQLDIRRSRTRRKEVESQLLPENLENLIQRRDGYQYKLLRVNVEGQLSSLGIALQTRGHQVTVTRVRGIGERYFKKYDRIWAINGVAVSDRKIVRQLMRDSGGVFEAAVERPESEEAIRLAEKDEQQRATIAATAAAQQTNEYTLPSDAEDIASSELKKRMENRNPSVPRSCLARNPQSVSTERRVQVTPGHSEVEIASDVDPRKQLKQLPRSDTS